MLNSSLTLCFVCAIVSGNAILGISGRHVCDRKCSINGPKMTCLYNFTVENYVTMSRACYKCPIVKSDCYRKDCIAADGVQRLVVVANRLLPGPLIVVCENDTIVVDVKNHAGSQATSIHWHGIRQRNTQFMDGVPFITQCPIPPYDTFRYKFNAQDTGTHFWHGHIGFHRTDGLQGMLVVRQAAENDPNSKLYDFDLSEHTIMLSEWPMIPFDSLYSYYYHTQQEIQDFNILVLINGRGQRQKFSSNGTDLYTPVSVFKVEQHRRYRFRMVSAALSVCRFGFSIENHTLTVIATDGNPIAPVNVQTVIIGPGERIDFVIRTNKPPAKYQIKAQGLFICTLFSTQAILDYSGANNVTRYDKPEKNLKPVASNEGSTLNSLGSLGEDTVNLMAGDQEVNEEELSLFKSDSVDVIMLDGLDACSATKDDVSLRKNPDVQFILTTGLYKNIDPGAFDPVYYPWDTIPLADRHPVLLVNEIAFTYPPSPLLSQYKDVNKNVFCNAATINKNCTQEFCKCVHRLNIKLNAIVEIVFINVGNNPGPPMDHPFHLHGYHFRVVSQKGNITNNSVETFKKLDSMGQIERKLHKAVIKDTVPIPADGYVIIRFQADNPGFWIMHCHDDLHNEIGQAVLLQVGNISEMPKTMPDKFPQCGNFLPRI